MSSCLVEVRANVTVEIRRQKTNNIKNWTSIGELFSDIIVQSEKRVDSSGRVYFVNHRNRTTQWQDPRLQG